MPAPVGLAHPAVDRSRTSPNHNVRAPGHERPDAIILHYTGMADGPSAVDWLCNPDSSVSCHYVVAEDGGIFQLVDEDRRAWHAGRSSWHGLTDLNSASIGIEIINGGHDFGLPAFPAAQIDAVVALCGDIVDRHAIPSERVLAHSDIAPARKRDPGELFPWEDLHRRGVGHWVEPAAWHDGPALSPESDGDAVSALQRGLAAYGYGLMETGHYDADTLTVVRAFQRHFRPALVDGLADASTCNTLARLTAALVGA